MEATKKGGIPLRIVVKVGTTTLAHGTGNLNIRRVTELCRVLSDLKNAGNDVILVSSGAIGMGVGKLSLSEKPDDIPGKQALFGDFNHVVAQILITGDDVQNEVRYQNFSNTIHRLLEMKALPIINENDTISVEEIQIGDNDTLGAIVAKTVGADLLVILTDTDGLYTAWTRTPLSSKRSRPSRRSSCRSAAAAGPNRGPAACRPN